MYSSIHRKLNLVSRNIDPHQTGQWLAAYASKENKQVELLLELGSYYVNAHFQRPWTPDNYYVEESVLHAAVWHTVITQFLVSREISNIWPAFMAFDSLPEIAFEQCLHGFGHGAMYISLFRAGLMRSEDYSACKAFPSQRFSMPTVIKLAGSACDGAPTNGKKRGCLHGAYHAASVLGDWGMGDFVSSLANRVGDHADPSYRNGPLFRFPWGHFKKYIETPFDQPSMAMQLARSPDDQFIINTTVKLLLAKAEMCRNHAMHKSICFSEVSCFTC